MNVQSIIDWEKTIEMNDDDPDDAQHIMKLFYTQSLPQTRVLFVEAFEQRDIMALRAAAHRLAGTLLYLSAPDLDGALKCFHGSLKNEPGNQEKLAKEYQVLLDEINRFNEYYEKESSNKA